MQREIPGTDPLRQLRQISCRISISPPALLFENLSKEFFMTYTLKGYLYPRENHRLSLLGNSPIPLKKVPRK